MMNPLGRPFRWYSLASKLYPAVLPRELVKVPMHSVSQRVMLENGFIEHAGSPGLFHLLPLAVRSLEKLNRIICEEMDAIGAQKVILPSLVNRYFMEKSGRWSVFGDDLFQVKDRLAEEYCLAPTHEESVAHLVGCRLKQMSAATSTPLLLYQITSKFRDEKKSRYGLLRCREFLMKDLYSFDVDENAAKNTYELCSKAYQRIFTQRLGPLKLPVMRVVSDVGAMGGTLSHEYHFKNDCGEDRIDYCENCNVGLNRELLRLTETDPPSKCGDCKREMTTFRTVEVAHTFLLGTKYSEAFDVCFSTPDGQRPAYMGCYGIGVTRLLAVIIESYLNVSHQMRWPPAIAPYVLCIIPPKAGSKEENSGATVMAKDVLEMLSRERNLKGEIVCDDRVNLTVGRRLVDAKRIGYPYIVVVNKSAVQDTIPKFEFYDLTGEGSEGLELVTHEELFARFRSFGY